MTIILMKKQLWKLADCYLSLFFTVLLIYKRTLSGLLRGKIELIHRKHHSLRFLFKAVTLSAFAASLLAISWNPAYSLPEDRDKDKPDVRGLLDRLAAHQAYRFFYVPAPAPSDTATASQRSKSQTAQKKTPVDPSITLKAYTGESGEGQPPQQIFDEFMKKVAGRARQGHEIMTAMEGGEWKEKLIRATIATLNANGANSPAAIKQLVQDGQVHRDHARLMWYARDILVKEAAEAGLRALRAKHKNLHFDLTILDSGSFGSVTSDIDKTIHLVARDRKTGKPVTVHGSGGLMSYDDLVKQFYEHFNKRGKFYGAPKAKPAHLSLDTEFFATDTLPESFAKGRFFKSVNGELPLNKAAAAKRKHSAALLRNPGPSYQFSGTVFSQVTGRAVEAQAGLKNRIDTRLQRMVGQGVAALAWEEALVFSHAACRQFSTTDDGRVHVKDMDVAEFLERNNLVNQYGRGHVAENAAGNFEKLVHKIEAVYRPDGSFDPKAWSAKKNDIAKYHDRGGSKDSATAMNPDENPPKGLGKVSRRYGPANSKGRFGKQNKFARPYTPQVHNDLFTKPLQRLYGSRPDADLLVRQDLDLFWLATQVSENIMALKDNPDLPRQKPRKWAPHPGETYPESKVLRPLTHYLKKKHPERFGSLQDHDQELLTAAKKLHVETAQRQTIVAAGGHLEEAVNLWLLPQHKRVKSIIREQWRSVVLKKRELYRLRRSGETDSETRKRIAALNQEIDEGKRILTEMRKNSRGIEADIYMTGLETVRRAFLLFNKPGTDHQYRQIIDQLPPKHRDAVSIMEGVWKAKARMAHKQRLRREAGLEPFDVKRLSRQGASQLAHGYMESFGIDTDAFFGRVPPGISARANSESKVLKRFFAANYVNYGVFDSAGRLIRSMQMSENLPWEERMAMLSETIQNEFVMGVPVVGPLWTTAQGVRAGDPKVAAGGAVSLGSEMAQVCLARAATVSQAAQLGGMAALVLSLARTTVEIAGHETFAPIQDHFLQLVTKGYVGKQPAGWALRVGTNKVNYRIPVTPLVATPGETSHHAFLYLEPKQAQRLAGQFLHGGRARAAKALYEWALSKDNLSKNNLGQDWREGTPISSPVMIDLATDFDALIADLGSHPLGEADDPQTLIDRLNLSREAVLELLLGHRALQKAVKERIQKDISRRDDGLDDLNLWLLAARQNLGWHLDEYFKREIRLLAAAMGGWKEESSPLGEDQTRILERHRALASSEFNKHLQTELESVMDTPKRFSSLVEALKAQAADEGISWSHPQKMLSDYVQKEVEEWWTGTAKEKKALAAARTRRAVAAVAFRAQGFSDPRPEWYGKIENKRKEEQELLEKASDDPDPLKKAQHERRHLEDQYRLLDQGFREAEAVVAPKIAHLRLMDWLDGTGAFDNDVHAGLSFLWHDGETQRKIRDRVAADLTMSRQLLWSYRGFTSTYRALLQAELNEVRTEYARATDHAIQRRQREAAARLAELRAQARERAQAFDGGMRLEIEPDLIVEQTEDGKTDLRVHAEIAVVHDTLRAETIELDQGIGFIPGEDIERVIGAEALARALRLTGLDKDEIAFAVRIDAKVTSATPAEGFEDLKYENLPSSEGHLLLFPGPKAKQIPKKLVLTTVEQNGEPIDILGYQMEKQEDLDVGATDKQTEVGWALRNIIQAPMAIELGKDFSLGFCTAAAVRNRLGPGGQALSLETGIDAGIGILPPGSDGLAELADEKIKLEVSKQSQEVVAKVNPRINFRLDQEASRPPDYYRYLSDNGQELNILVGRMPEDVSSTSERSPGATSRANDRSGVMGQPSSPDQEKFGSRVTFILRTELREGESYLWSSQQVYRLIYRPLEKDEEAPVFKQPAFADSGCVPPKTEEVVVSGTPVLKLVRIEGPRTGKFTGIGSGHYNVSYADGDTGFSVATDSRYYPNSIRTLRVTSAPLEITLGEPFEIAAEIKKRKIHESRKSCFPEKDGSILYPANYGYKKITDRTLQSPRMRIKPGNAKVIGKDDLHVYCRSNDTTIPEGRVVDALVEKDGSVAGRVIFTPDRVETSYPVIGSPERKYHYRLDFVTDGELKGAVGTSKVIKKHVIKFNKRTNEHGFLHPEEEARRSIHISPFMAYFSFAHSPYDNNGIGGIGLYYDAIHEGDPHITSLPDYQGPSELLRPPRDERGGTEETPGDEPAGIQDQPDIQGTDADSGEGGTGTQDRGDQPTTIDPATLDPNSPDVGALVRKWISIAKPPENAVEGANWRYDKFGRMVGSGPGMRTIDTRTHDSVQYGGGTPEASAWHLRKELDSINHCTMEEYVVAKLEQKSISHCAGRYGAVKNLKGEQLAKAKATVNNAGFEYSLIPGSPAKTTEEGGTIERQEPGPEQYLKKGQTVVLFVHAPYVPAVLVIPDFRGKPLADARNWLRENELKADLKAGRPAPSSDKSGMVASQDPSPGTKLMPGKSVELEVYGPYNPKVAVPDVTELSVKDAKARLEAKGLKARLVASGTAPSSGLSLKVKESEPKAGAKVSPGTEVTVKVYGKYSPPRVRVPRVAGLSVKEAKTNLKAKGLKARLVASGTAPSSGLSLKVKESEPKAGAKVAPGTEVTVKVYGKYSPPRVKVPRVAGLSVKEAKTKLKAKGLKARLVASGPAPSSGLSLKVKESEPKAGAKVAPGTEVTVKVYGKYSQPFVAVPKVAGLSFSNAKARLVQAGLKASAKSAGPAPSKAKSSRIKSQEPVAGEKVNPGSEVKVYVFSKYIPADPNERIEEREQVQAWVLVDTLVNPQNKPTEFIVGVTPNYYSPRYQGSFYKYKVEETYIALKKYWVDRGVIKANIEIRADFTKPPKTLVPGENISLKAKISANGTSPGIGTDVWFKYRAKGINLMGDTFTNSGTNSKPPYRTNSISSYFVVPNTHKGTIEIYASLNCGACDVRWIYRAQKVDQGVK